MDHNDTLKTIGKRLEEVIQQQTSQAKTLWKELLEQHPADIADLLSSIDRDDMQKLFSKLPQKLKFSVFKEFSEPLQIFCLSFLTEQDQADMLHSLSIDELTDLFDSFSDEELKRYLNLLNRKSREKVLSLLKFHPESAGGIMDIGVLTLLEDYTVERSIKLLQRLRPDQEVYRQIYVTNKKQQLVGHINLEDLVVRSPKKKISEIMRKNEFIAMANEDRETITQKMVHYNLTIVPVIGDDNYFLGVISSEILADVLVEEAGEDVQRMAGLAPTKETYLETPFHKILLSRAGILVPLLIVESATGLIINSYEASLSVMLTGFIAMLMSTGGNTSHQTSALVLQGFASGELHSSNMSRFLKRELLMALAMALILGISGLVRAYFTTGDWLVSSVIGLTLSIIVMLAVLLGSGVPFLLKKIHIDPAFSAGPFLATFMDILGVFVYVILIRAILTMI